MAAGKRKGGALHALTAAALALPPLQAAAQFRDEQQQFSLRYSQYGEASLPNAQPENSRYDIDVYQLRYGFPAFRQMRFTLDAQYETMTGASPWFIEPDENGKPVQIMSGATIDERRADVSLDSRLYGDGKEWGARIGVSDEKDYRAYSAGLDTTYEIGGQTSLSGGIGGSVDTLRPTDAGTAKYPLRPIEEDKRSVDAVIGLTRIINPRAVIQSGINAAQASGYLSDPYKQVSVQGTIRPDRRPDDRTSVAWSTRLRYRFPGLAAAARLDYRLYNDSWDITSHTLELGWYQSIGERWSVLPRLRYYSQSAAYFYRPFFVNERDDGYYSSDYRLSPYGALTIGAALTGRAAGYAVTLAIDHYDSSDAYALGTVELANPGLVDFTLITVGFDIGVTPGD